jgi:hypothetical protein
MNLEGLKTSRKVLGEHQHLGDRGEGEAGRKIVGEEKEMAMWHQQLSITCVMMMDFLVD